MIKYKSKTDDIIEFTREKMSAMQWFYTGGCLLDHGINDIDILVVLPGGAYDIDVQEVFLEGQQILGLEVHSVSYDYLIDGEDGYFAVVQLKSEDIKYDLLFVSDARFDVMDWFCRYPLSIQKIAQDVTTGEVFKDPTQEDSRIIVTKQTGWRKFYDKYKTYYPERNFICKDSRYPTLVMEV